MKQLPSQQIKTMKFLSFLSAIIILETGCQKTLVNNPCNVIPYQQVYLREFSPYLQQQHEYRITKYYTACSDEWQNLPDSVKDDIHVFSEVGVKFDGYIYTGNYIETEDGSFEEMLPFKWKAYGIPGNPNPSLDWVDFSYNPVTYTIEELKANQFILSRVINGTKYYTEFTKQLFH